MSETSIERLNYFNGQRLEAEDLRLEQEYHIRVQRWLSKSLFSPGWADGLDVIPIEDPQTNKKMRVLVTPGMALDDLGRAIIQVNPVELIPQAEYLCVRYAERKNRQQHGNCAITGAGHGAVARWDGAERIVSEAEFVWRRTPPQQDTREIVIAVLELNPDCSVKRVVSGPTHIAAPTQISRVFSFALEGEKDIDENNPKIIRFQVLGRTPNSVTLFLRSHPFSSLYYTEMGRHNHGSSDSDDKETNTFPTGEASKLDDHFHRAGSSMVARSSAATLADGTQANPNHSHQITSNVFMSTKKSDLRIGIGIAQGFYASDSKPSIFPPGSGARPAIVDPLSNYFGAVELFTRVLTDDNPAPDGANTGGVSMRVEGGAHAHLIEGPTMLQEEAPPQPPAVSQTRHNHSVTVEVSQKRVGSSGMALVRNGEQLHYLSTLLISIDGSDKADTTRAVLQQLAKSKPSTWTGAVALGSGTGDSQDPLANDGTGAIRLDLLDVEGLSFHTGEHEIELSVAGDGNGGCIHYNLYVE